MASHHSTTKQELAFYVLRDGHRVELDLSTPKLEIESGLLKEWEENELLLKTTRDLDPELIISDETVEKYTRIKEGTGSETTWRWNPKGKVGYHTLVLDDSRSRAKIFTGQCYISPSRVDRINYDGMLAEIQKICYSLVYDFYRNAFEFVKEEEVQGIGDAQEQFKKIKETLTQLERILARMSRRPHKALTKRSRPEYVFASRRPDGRELRRLVRHADSLVLGPSLDVSRSGLVESLPLEIPNVDIVDTYDVPENRLVKYFIHDILGEQTSLVSHAAAKEIEQTKQNVFHYENIESKICRLEEVISRCAEFRQRLSLIQRKYPFLQEAGRLKTIATMSLVLQRERNYREFYKLYLDFMKKRARLVYSDAFFMTIKEIQELYEMYCLLEIIELSRQIGFKTVRQNLFQAEELKFTYKLSSGSGPVVTMRKGGARLNIFYKKEYNRQSLAASGYGSMAETHIPDMSLELYISPQSSIPEILIFDAKYRNTIPQIIDKLGTYKHDIGRSGQSIVKYALALWIDNRDEYRAYLHTAGTGGFYFVPNTNLSDIKGIMAKFAFA